MDWADMVVPIPNTEKQLRNFLLFQISCIVCVGGTAQGQGILEIKG
jgi:hypothetical protein